MMAHDFSGPIHAAQASGADEGYHFYDFQPLTSNKGWMDKYKASNSWTRSYQEQECLTCGVCRDVRGTSTYTGKGLFSYLNGLTRDPPSLRNADDTHFEQSGHGRFASVPRPPPNWRGMSDSALGNGEKDDGSGFGAAATPPDLSLLRVRRTSSSLSSPLAARSLNPLLLSDSLSSTHPSLRSRRCSRSSLTTRSRWRRRLQGFRKSSTTTLSSTPTSSMFTLMTSRCFERKRRARWLGATSRKPLVRHR